MCLPCLARKWENSRMKIPAISMKFRKLLYETKKDYVLLHLNGVDEVKLPKNMSEVIAYNEYECTFNITPFKFKEITGIVPQSLKEFNLEECEVIDDVIDDIDLLNLPEYELYEAQKELSLKAKNMSLFCLNGEMRIGKTVIIGSIAYSRYKAGVIDKLIVIAPLRTEKTWKDHIKNSIPFEFYAIEHFSNENTRTKIEIKCDDKSFVYLDESHKIKNNNVIRTNYIINSCNMAGFKAIGTGTLIGKHAGDLFYQFYFLSPSILGYSSYQYMSDCHLLYGGKTGHTVVGYINIEEFSRLISPYILRISRSQVDINTKKVKNKVKYSIENKFQYSELMEEYSRNYDENNFNEVLKYITKLQQSASGFIFNEDSFFYVNNGRISCLENILKNRTGKICIYYKYNEEATLIKSKLNIKNILKGGLSQTEFDTILSDFNSENSNIILIQQSISTGFKLDADCIVYYSTTFDLISRSQSEDRCCSIEKESVKIIDIVAENTIDERIIEVIEKKSNLYSALKEEINLWRNKNESE